MKRVKPPKKDPTPPAPDDELDEPLTIEKHLLEDIKGGTEKPNPAPDRGPYPGSETW